MQPNSLLTTTEYSPVEEISNSEPDEPSVQRYESYKSGSSK